MPTHPIQSLGEYLGSLGLHPTANAHGNTVFQNSQTFTTAVLPPTHHTLASVDDVVIGFDAVVENGAVAAQAVPDIMDQVVSSRVSKAKMATEIKGDVRPFQELYSYPGMKMYKSQAIDFEKNFAYSNQPMNWVTNHAIVGVEIEVENITDSLPLSCFWSSKADGSLRNNGVEIVSWPMYIKHVQCALEHVYQALNKYNTPDFSNRTSIHIHLNCRDMTQDQLWNLVVLYTIFEKHFFKFAGTKRLSSIFCVPVYRTNILRNLNNCIYSYNANSWHKYCGINLVPMFDNNQRAFGTVEFRHLYGTNDPKVVMNWINHILCLRKAAMSMTKEDLLESIKTMNTTSSYMSLYSNVFQGVEKLLSEKRDFEDCVSSVKRAFFKDTYSETLMINNSCEYVKVTQSINNPLDQTA